MMSWWRSRGRITCWRRLSFCEVVSVPDMEKPPPPIIDGATVVEWAWSGDLPFGEVPGSDSPWIHGLAIATYDGKGFYRFSCDRHWEVQQDDVYESLEEAKQHLPQQYRNVDACWRRMGGGEVG